MIAVEEKRNPQEDRQQTSRLPTARGIVDHLHWIRRPWPLWLHTLILFVLVATAEFAFGMWMNSRGFVYIDAYSRAISALLVLHGSDPHLASIGFVWMPLPSLLELVWVAWYPLWPGIVSSGFTSTMTSALAGGASAALLFVTARAFGLRTWLAWTYALLIALNPMLFLYGGNGLSESVAAPCLIGAVCALLLYWRTGLRRYLALSGAALALGVASLYEAVPFAGAVLVALIASTLWSSRQNWLAEARKRWQGAESFGMLIIMPSVYVLVLWVAANALIMKNPLYFATSVYSNYGQTVAVGGGGLAREASGNVVNTLSYVLERAIPFLIPGMALIVVRAMEGRLLRIRTLLLLLLLLSVPFGLIMPLIYLKDSFGWLRFFMYPLFVAAAWGIYEISLSRQRRAVVGMVLAGWILAAPVIAVAMANPALGQEEHWEMESLRTGKTATQIVQVNQKGDITRFPDWIDQLRPVSAYLDKEVFAKGEIVAVDAFQGSAIAAQVPPSSLNHLLILTQDREFKPMIEHPRQYHITYLLVPNSTNVPQDAINRTYPALWSGRQPGFTLAHSFPETPQEWRLYRVTTSGQQHANAALGHPGGGGDRTTPVGPAAVSLGQGVTADYLVLMRHLAHLWHDLSKRG
jgi:hypothetical protein